MNDLFLIAGLGNPGSRYDNTRHNVGFATVDLIASQNNIKISKLKHKAVYGEGSIEGSRVIISKPQTFMNLSGESIRDMVEWYKMPSSHIIIIYDDVDLPYGKIRIRPKGSSGTHNGMRSILYQLATEDFPRIRIGIGRPPEGWDLADYVLGKFNESDRKTMDESIKKAADAAREIIKSGAESAMNKFNKD